MNDSALVLRVNDVGYGGWKSVSITLGMEQVAGSFELGVSERWPNQPESRPIRPGDACAVLIGEETIITGYVDDADLSYDARSHDVRVTGRDKTGDLVDCSAVYKCGDWRGVDLKAIATDICSPFGVYVTSETDLGAVFKRFCIQEGETAFEAIERAAKMRGVLLLSDGKGGLVLTRASTDRVNTVLKLGENIERASGNFSHKERFSQYIVKGQSPGDDWSTPEHNAQTKAIVADEGVKRYRPMILIAEQGSQTDYQNRARWERNMRIGRGSRAMYTVTGWSHADGLWKPNRLIQVKDDFLGIDGDLIVAEVKLVLDDSGTTTQLTLCRREGFDLPALAEEKQHKSVDEDAMTW